MGERSRALLATLPPLVAFAVEWVTLSTFQPSRWFLFYPAVFISSWIGGFWAGLRATALSLLLVWWFFLPPFHGRSEEAGQLLPILVFVGTGVLFAVFHARFRHDEALLRDLVEHAADGIFVADLDGRYVQVNSAACRMLGYSRQEIIGKSIVDLIPSSDRERLVAARRYLLGGEAMTEEWTLRRKDGTWMPVEVTAKILPDRRWQAFVRDIRERKQTEEQLRQAAIVFSDTSEAIIITNADAEIVAVNPAFEKITGFAAADVLGQNPRFQKSGRHDEDFYRQMWTSLTTSGRWQGEIWNRRKSGDLYPAWESISAVREPDGRVTRYVSVLSDISAVKLAEERLSYLAHHDVLTDLPNRLLFTLGLEKALERAQRQRERVALLFLDLDRFKLINDTLGHVAGDRLLQEIGRRLRASVRAADTVARLGGDEFTVVLENISEADDAARLASKILAAVHQPVDVGLRKVLISASIGISLYPDDATGAEDLAKAADAAMYRAKERGRNTFDFFTARLTSRAVEHLTLEHELRGALERGELELYYQPQVQSLTGRIAGVEALLRWRAPDGRLILPKRLIEVAEESELIEAVGGWVVERACAQAREWLDAGLQPGRIAINVSGRQLVREDVIDLLAAGFGVNDLRPKDLQFELEITESVLHAPERTAGVLQRARALGVRIAIDDFGTGYSSLSLLRQLPIDCIKIDQTFVANLAEDANSQAIVAAMVAMAHGLGLRALAEGVETEEQAARLRQSGCDEMQGYLFGEAVPAEVVAQRFEGVRS